MKRFAFLSRLVLIAAASCAIAVTALAAPQYPAKPIRVIVGFPPGAAADNVARIVGNALTPALGQLVIVENKPGADSAIAAASVAKSIPDGYTLFFGSSSGMVAAPALRKEPPYNPVTDFTPVCLIGHGTLLLFTHASVPANTLPQLIDYARANPEKLNYATGNPIAIVGTAQLMRSAGIRMTHVPYKGEAVAVPDLIANRVQLALVATVSMGLPQVKEGKLRVLAAMVDRRSPLAPDVPTFDEQGIPGVTARLWAGIFGPPNMPADVVARLSSEMNQVLRRPDVREQLAQQGYDPQGSTPEELRAYVRDQYELWKRAVQEAGIPRQD